MKTIIILGALVISTGAFAQGQTELKEVTKQVTTTQSEIKQKGEQVEKVARERVSQTKEGISKIERDAVGEGKDMLDKAKISAEDKSEMVVDKKAGQVSAAEAKLKAKQVKTKADADAMIRMSKEETKETINSVDSKMVAARMKLDEKLEAKEITQAEFDEKVKQLIDFDKRKGAIVNEMNK